MELDYSKVCSGSALLFVSVNDFGNRIGIAFGNRIGIAF